MPPPPPAPPPSPPIAIACLLFHAAENSLSNPKVASDLMKVIHEAELKNGCSKAIGNVLYMDKLALNITTEQGKTLKDLLLLPESYDSTQLSQIETEKLLARLVEAELNKMTKEGTYKGKKFNAICHFFGYQARGVLPSKFNCDYAYVLGHICYHILAAGLNGYMATVTNLKQPVNKWRCGATPITAMMTVKRYSHGPGATPVGKLALHPASIDLKGKAYELCSRPDYK